MFIGQLLLAVVLLSGSSVHAIAITDPKAAAKWVSQSTHHPRARAPGRPRIESTGGGGSADTGYKCPDEDCPIQWKGKAHSGFLSHYNNKFSFMYKRRNYTAHFDEKMCKSKAQKNGKLRDAENKARAARDNVNKSETWIFGTAAARQSRLDTFVNASNDSSSGGGGAIQQSAGNAQTTVAAASNSFEWRHWPTGC